MVNLPEHELVWSFTRSGGPGGQHANTSDTRAVVRWDVAGSAALTDAQRARLLERWKPRLTAQGVLILSADSHRSQTRNRAEVLQRLQALLDAGLAPPPPARRATRPSRAATEQRLGAKHRRSERKQERRKPSSEDY